MFYFAKLVARKFGPEHAAAVPTLVTRKEMQRKLQISKYLAKSLNSSIIFFLPFPISSPLKFYLEKKKETTGLGSQKSPNCQLKINIQGPRHSLHI